MLVSSIFSSLEHEVRYCDSAVSVTRSLGQILEKPCVHSRGHILSQIILKLGQNVCLNKILDEFENGSCRVEN